MSDGFRTALQDAYTELEGDDGGHVVVVSYTHPDGSITNRAWRATASVSSRVVELLDAWATPLVEHHLRPHEVDEAEAMSTRLETPPLWLGDGQQ